MPEGEHHAAITGVLLKSFDEIIDKVIAIYDPAVGGANGVSEIGFGFVRMILSEDLVDVATLIFARFGNFPLVPDFDAAFLKPADVVRGDLVNPEDFEDGGFPADFFADQDREFLFEVKLENLMREANSTSGGFGLGSVVRNARGDGFAAVVGAFVIGDFLAVVQNAPAKLNILIVKL